MLITECHNSYKHSYTFWLIEYKVFLKSILIPFLLTHSMVLKTVVLVLESRPLLMNALHMHRWQWATPKRQFALGQSIVQVLRLCCNPIWAFRLGKARNYSFYRIYNSLVKARNYSFYRIYNSLAKARNYSFYRVYNSLVKGWLFDIQ